MPHFEIARPFTLLPPFLALTAGLPACAPEASILEAASARFRPIMMTTMAALMGTLPIALGAGAESRRPLGLAVVGGLAFSQLVTLYVGPVFYVWFDELQHWFATRRAGTVVRSEGTA